MTVDMWDTNGPGLGLNGSQACSQTTQTGCTYQDEVFVQRIAAVLDNHTAAQPLFLFWAPHAPHDPYQVPDAYLAKPVFAAITQPERQYYAAMVNLLDDNVGRVVAMLKAKGLWDNSLVVFSSVRWQRVRARTQQQAQAQPASHVTLFLPNAPPSYPGLGRTMGALRGRATAGTTGRCVAASPPTGRAACV